MAVSPASVLAVHVLPSAACSAAVAARRRFIRAPAMAGSSSRMPTHRSMATNSLYVDPMADSAARSFCSNSTSSCDNSDSAESFIVPAAPVLHKLITSACPSVVSSCAYVS